MGRLSLEEMVNPGLLESEVDDIDNHEQLEAETQTQVEESEAEQQDMERTIDLAESLESIRETLSANSNWTPSEIRLAGIATEMAYAGCDVPSKSLVALEGVDRSVALEGIGSRIMGVLKTLSGAMAKMWAGLKERMRAFIDLFRSYESILARFDRELEEYKKEGKTETSVPAIKTFGCALDKNGSLIRDFGKISSRFSEVSKTLEKLATAYNKSVKVIGAGYGRFELFKDLLDVEKAGRFFFKNTVTAAESIRSAAHFDREVDGDKVIYTSETFPGGYSLVVCEPLLSNFELDNYPEVKRASMKFDIGYSREHTDDAAFGHLEMAKPIKLGEVASLVGEMRTLVSALDDAFAATEHLIQNEQAALERTIAGFERWVGTVAGTLASVASGNPQLGGTVAGAIVNLSPTKMLLSSYRIMTTNNEIVIGGVNALFGIASNALRSGVAMTRFLVMRGKWV